ncbi:trypsin-like peptidase domain-containing protein [Alterisphingorhabdus coralli]|uniref:Trypsin-like peptidase domain-containing protein n=1 Tax=Alterisphingorhabdus coralli TaxID=3071408 RepID=A0AA97F6G5_9SPHN|nr:trypsin-like peptidase domain-containing protein [Parasphingorhabdus sp. SCSIO 66989]WOE74168.1 trypsin-like peptidase domain-containing protein [Parasphingorhabdus sp. SCSIO 66989]
MTLITRLLPLLTLILSPILMAQPAYGNSADIQASSRSVVRVALIAMQGDQVFFLGHGSGFAVAPNVIVTNAHVVQPSINDSTIIVGVVPSEGRDIYKSRVIAFAPDKDLALLRLDEGSLEPLSIFASAARDGDDIVAIGYPGAVDRALGLTDGDKVEPGTPVKTKGTISGGRSNREFATLLHTAPVARGNSGGPIVDECGRVVGVNSFISVSDGSDAEFGFAISNQELLSFLRGSGIRPRTTSTPCRSPAQISQAETERALAEIAKQGDEAMARASAEQRRQAALERSVDQQIRSEREDYMALAMVLLVLSGFAGTSALVMDGRSGAKTGIGLGFVAVFLAGGAAALFFLRPSYDEFAERLEAALEARKEPPSAQNSASNYVGNNICKLDSERSRITISDIRQAPFTWSETGCVNGRTQYSQSGDSWVRILVPNQEQTVSVNRFDPQSGELTMSRYLLGRDAMQKARTIRARFNGNQCTDDMDIISSLQDVHTALLDIIPDNPNERLVFQCEKQAE